jgi:hypothetical protein
MSRWSILIFPLICLLLLTGSCGCKKSAGSTLKCKYDPQQADSAIVELTQKMTDLQAELKELKKEKTPANQANVPNLDEDNAGVDCYKAWQAVVDQFSQTLQKHEKAIGELNAQLIRANATVIQAEAGLELAKREFARVQKAANVQEDNAAKEAIEKALDAARLAEEKLKEAVKQSQEAVETSQKATEESLIYKKLQALCEKVQEQAAKLSKQEETNKKLDTHGATVMTHDAMFRELREYIDGELKEIKAVLRELTGVDSKDVISQVGILRKTIEGLEARINKLEEKKGFFGGLVKK